MSARLPALAALLALAAIPARAGLFGRDKLVSRWSAKPLAVDGDDSAFDEGSAFEDEGYSVQAVNDADSLYLLVSVHSREGRDQLTGAARQDLTLWFVGADGKTRDWGLRLPYSRRLIASDAPRDPAGYDPEPELTRYEGAAVSSAPCPSEIKDRIASSGRRPVWEIKIPLSRLTLDAERGVRFDFVVSAGARRKPRSADEPNARRREPEGEPGGVDGRGAPAAPPLPRPEESFYESLSFSLRATLSSGPAKD